MIKIWVELRIISYIQIIYPLIQDQKIISKRHIQWRNCCLIHLNWNSFGVSLKRFCFPYTFFTYWWLSIHWGFMNCLEKRKKTTIQHYRLKNTYWFSILYSIKHLVVPFFFKIKNDHHLYPPGSFRGYSSYF